MTDRGSDTAGAPRETPDGRDSTRWRRVKELLGQVLDLPEDQRPAFLQQSCGDDPELRAEIEGLLASSGAHDDFLERPLTWTAALDENAEEDSSRIGSRVGPYRLERCLGRGGMGAVYLGVRDDGVFERRVAVKIVRRGMATREVLRRFEREREIVAGIEHPNIVRLLDGGTTSDGLPHFIMEHVDGESVDRWCDRRRLGVRERVELFGRICEAVRFAHDRGLVHRDLKPSNVLVTEEGSPKIVDFGIAKVLSPEPGSAAPTRAGERPVTPEYASPEHVRGEPVTRASDVYSLGVMLYGLLAGRPPYRFETLSPREIERVVCDTRIRTPSDHLRGERVTDAAGDGRPAPEEDPATLAALRSTDPATLRRTLRGDLDAIVLKALRREPGDRYASAGELADDLGRYLEGRPVTARGGTLLYYWKRRLDPRRLSREMRTAIAIAGLALAGALALVGWDRFATPPPLSTTFHERDWVLLADVDDLTGGAGLGRALDGVLERGLSDSRYLNVATRERIGDALEVLKRPVDSPLEVELARAIADRDRQIRAIVAARVEPSAPGYRLEASVIDPQAGTTVSRFSEHAEDEESLVRAALSVSARVRESLGEDPAAVAESRAVLEEVTSPSLLALRLYAEAMARFGSPVATELLREAVSADPGFASGHIYLAHALRNQGASPDDYMTHAIRAFELADGATPRERYFIEGSYHQLTGEAEKARIAYETLVSLYPDHYWANNNLLYLALEARRPADVRRHVTTSAEVRPMDFESNQFAAWVLAASLGDTEAAARYRDRAAELLAPEDHSYAAEWVRSFPAQRAWLAGDVEPLLERALSERDSLEAEARGERPFREEEIPRAIQTAWAFEAVGRSSAADELLAAISAPGDQAAQLAILAWVRNDEVAVARQLERASRWPSRSRHALPSLLVRAGRIEEAAAMAAEFDPQRSAAGYAELVAGEVARGRGELDEAVEQLSAAVDLLPLANSAYYLAVDALAVTHRERGDLDSAIRTREQAALRKARTALIGNQALWLRSQMELAGLCREAGRLEDARAIEEALRPLLRHADSDHPIALRLRAVAPT